MLLDASQGASASQNQSTSSAYSWSNTAGNAATEKAIQAAQNANQSAQAAWQQAADYNAQQAAIQREWQERMANTVYQRTVKDMKAAGINPILAANMGLGTASVGSGATASLSAPDNYMAKTFAEQNSASQSQSQSTGSSWSNSESGLATAITQIAGLIGEAIGAVQSSNTVNFLFDPNNANSGTAKFLVGDTPVTRYVNSQKDAAQSAVAAAAQIAGAAAKRAKK